MANLLRSKISAFRRDGFTRAVGMLVGGTALAQVITMLALPFITRLYQPSDFSALAVYVSTLAIVSAAASLRLELAIPMPELDEEAIQLLVLALFFSTLTSVITLSIAIMFGTEVTLLLKQPALESYLWLIPIGVWSASSYAAFQFWSIRTKDFGLVAKTRVGQALGGALTQLSLGLLGGGTFGLLLGHLISSSAGVFSLGRRVFKDSRGMLRTVSYKKLRLMLRKYDRFPKYATVEVVANNIGVHLPIIIIAAASTGSAAGFLFLAIRLMAAPMGLIGAAVAQVYVSRAPSEWRGGNLGPFTAEVIGRLIKTGVGPLIFADLIAEHAFPIIFGGAWANAGNYIVWMTPWFIMQFITSPVSMTLDVTGNQRIAMLLQIVGIFIRAGSVFVCFKLNIPHVVEVYAVSGFIFYSLYLLTVMTVSKMDWRILGKHFFASIPLILVWIISGVFVRIGIGCLAFR